MKNNAHGRNIGLYADLYGTFYENKVWPAERAFVGLDEDGNLFLAFFKMTPEQKKGFPKEAFTKSPWPSESSEKDRLERSTTGALRKNKALSQGGMSADMLEFNSNRKYMLLKRTSDVTKESLEQARKDGIPAGQPGRTMSDFVALKFGQKDGAILMYIADSPKRQGNSLSIFRNVLSGD